MENQQFILETYVGAKEQNQIPDSLYSKYRVKKGLRNEDGTGVVIGLTRICDVVGYKRDADGAKVDIPGQLQYRGLNLEDVYQRASQESSRGYEEICFLLLFGRFPSESEMTQFEQYLRENYEMPETYLGETVFRKNSMDVMNRIQSALLYLYAEDGNADDCSEEHFLKQGLAIIAKLPSILCYSYQSKAHHLENKTMMIHPLRKDIGLAEEILHLLRGPGNYKPEEVKLLDLMMILHADHGMGNNSTFTSLVVASSGTDIYSSFSAAVGSLKGPKHGGANITCKHMMDAIVAEIGTHASDEEIVAIVNRLLDKEFFDHKGLVYGIGHAVYTISDPRCVLLKKNAKRVADILGYEEEYDFYQRFERIAVDHIGRLKKKDICANVDFYSGFIYSMMGIPEDLFTPIFVASRMIGWLAHNLEEKMNSGRIIRPAGLYVSEDEINTVLADKKI